MVNILFVLLLALSPLPAYAQDGVDMEPPSEVMNLAVVSESDASVTLSWDAATDNVGVVGYRINYGTEPVTATTGEYTSIVDIDDVTEYTVADLANGTTYYFTVTAFDAANNESPYYSNEVGGTPAATEPARSAADPTAAVDTTAPIVLAADARDAETVAVVFSEPVTLPSAPDTAFSIQLSIGIGVLAVTNAQLDPDDAEGKTVLVTTALQEEDAVYLLTTSSTITDASGNPIISGTSDTAPFRGYVAPAEPLEEIDVTGPTVVSAAAQSETEIHVTLSEPATLPDDPFAAVTLGDVLDPTFAVELSTVELDESRTVLRIITFDPLPSDQELVVTVSGVFDDVGNMISADPLSSTASFRTVVARAVAEDDTTPPEDATNFASELINGLVRLTWTASLNSARDLADQVLYRSTDGGSTFEATTNLGPVVSQNDVSSLTPGQTYTFKLTMEDDSGNESAGVLTNITLPETGAGLGLLLVTSLGLGRLVSRRRKIERSIEP